MKALPSISVLALLLLFATPSAIQAQEFSLGADFVSRYVWRGYDFGESLSIQPSLVFSRSGFEVGTWASYSIAADGSFANEHDIWIGYTVETEAAGSFSLGVTDYFFPAPDGLGFFEFDGGGNGAHWIEPYVAFTGPESFPISLYGAVFVHNDPDHSLYLQTSYPLPTKSIDLGLTLGAVAGESGFYGTTGFAVVNVGLSASKEVKLSDAFSLPVSVSYILNPDTERTYLIFGVSL